MNIDIAYGKDGLSIEVPDKNLVKILRMTEKPVIKNAREVINGKLTNPTGTPSLADIAKGKKSACIVISDITRPVPNAVILPPVLETLENAGIPRENITILIGTGIHRPNEDEEQITLLGPEIPKKYRVVNHMGRDTASHDYLGETPIYKAPIYVDKEYFKSELRIVTGLIEPHFMAGFSGGRKGIMPAICAYETVKVLHGPDAMGHEKAVGGIIEGNPVHAECLYVAKKAGVDFILNVSLNERREITGVFAGDLEKAHAEGVAFVRTQCVDTVDKPVDAVITSSAGFPLDLTFYQTVKGMTEAMPIVKPGGVIIIASKCGEGIGSKEFTDLLLETDKYQDFLDNIKKPGYYVLDQWEFQKFCTVLEKNEVWLISDGIDKVTQEKIFVTPLNSVEDGIARVIERFGYDARIAVIPEGPYVTARVAGKQ
ncbi:MAG: nickel-dependent lactate racemase [Candidatus Latescibacteria bacterium]|nr:nickel-dependent lactate racemase [Candidatus Latescibacterota bacterium]